MQELIARIMDFVWSLFFVFAPDPLSDESRGFLMTVISGAETAASTWGVADAMGNHVAFWWAQLIDVLLRLIPLIEAIGLR